MAKMCDGDYVLLKGLSHSMDQSNKMYTNFMFGIRNGNEPEKVFNRRLSDLIKFIVDILSDNVHCIC